MPSSDPSYFLTVSGLPDFVTGRGDSSFSFLCPPPGSAVTASIHATVDGSRLLSIDGLDEMKVEIEDQQKIVTESYATDFTLDKRFHLIPQSHLFITIPRTNDCLVLRRLDIETALDRAPGNYLVVTSFADSHRPGRREAGAPRGGAVEARRHRLLARQRARRPERCAGWQALLGSAAGSGGRGRVGPRSRA